MKFLTAASDTVYDSNIFWYFTILCFYTSGPDHFFKLKRGNYVWEFTISVVNNSRGIKLLKSRAYYNITYLDFNRIINFRGFPVKHLDCCFEISNETGKFCQFLLKIYMNLFMGHYAGDLLGKKVPG